MRKEITLKISVNQIKPHPDNPRKELGDLEEMVESIKKNGIMQNLTVIPEEALEKEEAEQRNITQLTNMEKYIVLIGHRRLAAAKKAGITEVSCRIITGISKKEQVGIMLEENMQRNDLTIWEQANGFQMMLDLGETEEGIAQKTGFSKQTVRRRLNIAKLDQKELKKKEEDEGFQMNLKHLYELEKVEDVETRNKILKEARNSSDLEWRINQAVNEKKERKNLGILKIEMRQQGIKEAPKGTEYEMHSGKWEVVKEISLREEIPDELKLPKEKSDNPFLYLKYYSNFRIIRKNNKKKKITKEEIERKEKDRRRKQLNEIAKRLHDRMKDIIIAIIAGMIRTDTDSQKIKEEIWKRYLENDVYISERNGIKFFTGKERYKMSEEEWNEEKQKFRQLDQLHQMLIFLWESIKGNELVDYYGKQKKETTERWMETVGILGYYGFYLQDEEEQLLTGTHELYTKEE